MQIVSRLIAMTRSIQLNRQFREVERAINGLPIATRRELATLAMREFASAAKCEFPHLYGTPPEQHTSDPWGKGTDLGISRVKSDNPHVRLRGIALWLTVAYHETKNTNIDLHRQLMRTLRVLKESAPQAAADKNWYAGAADQAVA